jgi:hypothetical protein
MEIEVGEKLRDGEVLEPGGVVGHAVGGPMDVGVLFAVTVVPLVETGHAAHVGGSRGGGDCTLVLARQSRGVVGQVSQGEFTEVKGVGRDIGAGHQSCLLEVAVGEVTFGVGGGDDARLDLWWEGCPPDDGAVPMDEDDTPHAGLGSVDRLERGWLFREEFGEARGPREEV